VSRAAAYDPASDTRRCSRLARAARACAAGFVLAVAPAAARAQTIAIVGGRVLPVSGPPIESGTVLIRDGVIAAVGADVTVPANARRIDARGRTVAPGLIHAASQVGLVEVPLWTNTRETQVESVVAASFNVAEGLNPASTLIPVTRIEGVTTAILRPGGPFVAGQSVLADLDGATIEQMIVLNPAALHVRLDEESRAAGGGARAATAARLRRLLADAREYGRRRGEYERRQMRELSAPVAELEALQPVLAGRLPLVVTAHRVFDIRNALRLAREFNLRLILEGASEGWQIADEIARAGVPVLVVPLSNLPMFNTLGARYENAALLAAAGVRLAIVSDDASHNARLIRQEAGNAVRFGLPWDAALRAVTLGPAEVFGVADRYGSLQPGRVANVVVWSGDPFEFSTAVEHVFIRGREVPLSSRQTELRERYRNLPSRP
jgi:imidazolonepropionase-like amidohydrolase